MVLRCLHSNGRRETRHLGAAWANADTQDKFSPDDCITIANFAIQALKAGYTSREIEKAIRKVRLTNKKASADPENEALNHAAVNALDELRSMGDTGNTGL